LVTPYALFLTYRRRDDVHVADKTGRPRLGSFFAVLDAKSFRVRRGLDYLRVDFRPMARWDINVTYLAIRHAVGRGNMPGQIMAVHAIGHFGERQIGQACAGRDPVMAGRAIQMVFLPSPEMLGVRKLYSVVLA
jgi:hypothetical protein